MPSAECATCFMGFTTPHPTALEAWIDQHLTEHPDHVLTQPQESNEG